jgi:hypothetical protein
MRTRKPSVPPSPQAVAARITKMIAKFPAAHRARILAAVQATLALDEPYHPPLFETEQPEGAVPEGAKE